MNHLNVLKTLVTLIFMTASQIVFSATVVEFYNPDLDHFFITADAGEQAFIDSGAVGNWNRTGTEFGTGGTQQVCRFYGSAVGPNSHFYTADSEECAYLKSIYDPAVKSWKFESNDFQITTVTGGACPVNTFPIYRAYNNGASRGVDSNHRLTQSSAAIQEVVKRGWKSEGIVMCASGSGRYTSTPTCPSPQVLTYAHEVYGACACPSSQVLVDGACATACPSSMVPKNGYCINANATELEGTWVHTTGSHVSGGTCGLDSRGGYEERTTLTFHGANIKGVSETCWIYKGNTGAFIEYDSRSGTFTVGNVYLTYGTESYKELNITVGNSTQYTGYYLNSNKLEIPLAKGSNDGSSSAKRISGVGYYGQPTFLKQPQ